MSGFKLALESRAPRIGSLQTLSCVAVFNKGCLRNLHCAPVVRHGINHVRASQARPVPR